MAYLDYQDDSNQHHTDSALVNGGHFIFTGKIQTPTFGILYFSSSPVHDNFFFEAGSTFMEGDTSKSSHINTRGGNSTSLFNDYKQTADSFTRYRSSLESFISGPHASNDSAIHAKYMDDFYLSMSEEETFTEQFVRKHPDSYVSAYLLYYKFSGEGNINKGIALLSILSRQIQQSKYARQLLQLQLNLKSSISGTHAPEFSEPDTSGKILRLTNIKARYILIDFWASWCGPCRRENPVLVEAYKKYHDKGFEILSVSFDQNRAAWINAINKDGLSWLNVSNLDDWQNDKVADLFGVNQIPANFLIDAQGQIVGKNLTGVGLDYVLEKQLGKQ